MPINPKAIALLIAHGPHKAGVGDDGAGEDDEEEGGSDEGMMAVAEDMIHAIKSGDAKALAECLESFHDMVCDHGDDGEGK